MKQVAFRFNTRNYELGYEQLLEAVYFTFECDSTRPPVINRFENGPNFVGETYITYVTNRAAHLTDVYMVNNMCPDVELVIIDL